MDADSVREFYEIPDEADIETSLEALFAPEEPQPEDK